MNRSEKELSINELSQIFSTSTIILVGQYSGIAVPDVQVLRRNMRAQGGRVLIAKNRLAKIAVKDKPASVLTPLLKGPTILGYSADPVVVPKVFTAFAKEHESFLIIGGVLGGRLLGADYIKQLSTLPSLDDIRATIIGLLRSPASKLVGTIKATPSKLARVIKAKADLG